MAIALPVHNGAEHLAEALQSFRDQTYGDFELVVCDNASTDGTAEIARAFADADARFRYIRQSEFLSAKDNFLRAHRLTDPASAYFLWACDDNIWAPAFLERTVGYMDAHPGCSVCGFYLHHFGSGRVRRVGFPMAPAFKWFRLLQFAFERRSIVSLYGLMRRTAVDRVDFDVRGIRDYPDRYYLLQLRAQGHFHVVQEDLLAFREGGISSSGDDPWVRSVVDMNFGEAELSLLTSYAALSGLEKTVIAWRYCYLALRHNIGGVARRWWLAPAYLLGALMNLLRPSPWRVTDRGLQRVDG